MAGKKKQAAARRREREAQKATRSARSERGLASTQASASEAVDKAVRPSRAVTKTVGSYREVESDTEDYEDYHTDNYGQEDDTASGSSLISNSESDDEDATSAQHVSSIMFDEYVEQQLASLMDAVPDYDQLMLASVPSGMSPLRLPRLKSNLLEAYCPKAHEGKVWSTDLIHWLRSGAILPLIKLWHDECMGDSEVFTLLRQELPPEEYPWKSQHAHITQLARLPDSGESTGSSPALLICAKFTRKVYLCNHDTLLHNAPCTEHFFRQRIMDIPCATFLTVYHDLMIATTSGGSFFSTLLASPLAKPMHQHIRTVIESNYPLAEAYGPNSDAIPTFFSPAAEFKALAPGPPTPRGPNDITSHASHYQFEPFTDKEQLLFWLGYREITRHAELFGIDCAHIGELLPGRCEHEIRAFLEPHKAALGLVAERRVIVAQTGGGEPAVGDKRPLSALTTAESEEDDEEVEEEQIEDGDAGEGASEVSTDDENDDSDDLTPVSDTTKAKMMALLSIGSSSKASGPPTSAADATSQSPKLPGAAARLPLYAPPPPQPPSPRTNLPAPVLAQIHVVDEARGARNAAQIALAAAEVALEDAIAAAKVAVEDDLGVQMALFERDEAAVKAEEAGRAVMQAGRELVGVKRRWEGVGAGVEGGDRAGMERMGEGDQVEDLDDGDGDD